MSVWNIVICAVVFILCFRWLMFIAIFPFMAIDGLRRQHRDNKWLKFFALPFLFLELITRRGLKRYFLIMISELPSNHLRKLIYRGLGAKIGKNAVFHFRTEVRAPEFLRVGNGTIIGDNALLDAREGLEFGDNVNLSSNVQIYTLQHDYRDPDFGLDVHRKPMGVKIGDRVWIGPSVIILPGVEIGEGAVCCAGAVITSDVKPFSVVAGIPAREVAKRPENMTYEFDGKSCRLY